LKRQTSPRIDPLEGRIVLSTFHAANVAQLQADIAAVDNTSGPNTIVLARGTYALTQKFQIVNAGNLTITTQGNKANVNLVGAVVDRVLEIDGGSVTLSGLSISGGGAVAQGGGILAQNAALTLQNTKVFGNVASEAGGGIFAQGGTLKLQNSSVMNNRTSSSSAALGGGIAALGTVTTLTGCTVSENSVYAADTQNAGAVSGTGGGIYADGGTLAVSKSTVSGNTVYAVTTGTSAASSGAAFSTLQTAVSVDGTTLEYNGLNTVSFGAFAVQGSAFSTIGGSLTVANSHILKNTPGGWGAFSHPGATLTIRNIVLDSKRLPGTRPLAALPWDESSGTL
jgi:hypothetical protein